MGCEGYAVALLPEEGNEQKKDDREHKPERVDADENDEREVNDGRDGRSTRRLSENEGARAARAAVDGAVADRPEFKGWRLASWTRQWCEVLRRHEAMSFAREVSGEPVGTASRAAQNRLAMKRRGRKNALARGATHPVSLAAQRRVSVCGAQLKHTIDGDRRREATCRSEVGSPGCASTGTTSRLPHPRTRRRSRRA